ncbi:MAG: hypothetical protein ACYDHE_21135 [Candidatus Acidiferrales bacterium]
MENETMDFSGTIFETREEKEARLLAKKQADWAELVAKANQANPDRCQERVSAGNRSFCAKACSNTAKFHREEHVSWDNDSPMITRHYCATHDLVSKRERQNKKYEEETRERNAKYAREDAARKRQDLIRRVVGHLTDEQLVALEGFLPGTPFAKKS